MKCMCYTFPESSIKTIVMRNKMLRSLNLRLRTIPAILSHYWVISWVYSTDLPKASIHEVGVVLQFLQLFLKSPGRSMRTGLTWVFRVVSRLSTIQRCCLQRLWKAQRHLYNAETSSIGSRYEPFDCTSIHAVSVVQHSPSTKRVRHPSTQAANSQLRLVPVPDLLLQAISIDETIATHLQYVNWLLTRNTDSTKSCERFGWLDVTAHAVYIMIDIGSEESSQLPLVLRAPHCLDEATSSSHLSYSM